MNYRDIAKAAVDQGWKPGESKKGTLWYSPDGVTIVTWHNTPSDVRAVRNFLAAMRRGGLIYPPPRKK